MSLTLDDDVADGIEALAKQYDVSRSDIVRSMYARMRLEKSLEELQMQATPLLEDLGLHTEDDIAVHAVSKD